MGQRHQIYIKLPYKFEQFKDYEENKKVKNNVIALHHQWLYGVMALKQLNNFMTFVENGKDNDYFIFGPKGFDNPENCAQYLYATNIEEGYYHRVSIESKELADNPDNGDNNDGITIIDLSGKVPKYCFMFVYAGGEYCEHYKPLTARQYVECYYGESVLERSKYWQENEDTFRELQKEGFELAEKLERFKVLTYTQVKNIFPKMYTGLAIEKAKNERIVK